MIHLVFGSNSFAVRERIDELIHDHAKSHTSAAISSFSEENFSAEEFDQALRNDGLFSQQKMIIMNGLLPIDDAKKIILSSLPLLKASSFLFVIQEEKITDAIKKKLEPYTEKYAFEECLPYAPKKLTSWLQKRAKVKNIPITQAQIQELITVHGKDQWRLDNALELWALGNKQDAVSAPRDSRDIFKLLDHVTGKDQQQAFLLYHRMLRSGTLPEEIFWKLYWQCKNMLLVSQYGNLTPGRIEEKTGLHPFVIKKIHWALARFSQQDIETVFEWLITLWQDDKIKTRNLAGELELFFLTLRPHVLTSRFL